MTIDLRKRIFVCKAIVTDLQMGNSHGIIADAFPIRHEMSLSELLSGSMMLPMYVK